MQPKNAQSSPGTIRMIFFDEAPRGPTAGCTTNWPVKMRRFTQMAAGHKLEIALLLHLVDEAYGKKAWHGPNLRGAIRRISAAVASWRPQLNRRSIADIVVHAAYWKYAVRRR